MILFVEKVSLTRRCDTQVSFALWPRNSFAESNLRSEDFSNPATGRLERCLDGYWTFIPAPLPPNLTFSGALVTRIAEAERALGELAGLGRVLPNVLLLVRPFVKREAVLSSRIEGTVTRLDQLLLFEATPDSDAVEVDDALEVMNYVRALDHGIKRLAEGMPLCLRLIRELHERLMTGVRGGDKRPGEFRNRAVMIGRPGQSFAQARFVPPHQASLDPLLNDFERFLNAPGDLPIVAQLALAHYQFEVIHPFLDGNGRLGRLLITLMLCERKILPQPLLYLSAFFEKHSQAYRDHLLHVSQRGAWNEWIEFFATGVAEQAQDAVSRSGRLLDLQQNYRERVQKTSQSSAMLRLVDLLFASPFVTLNGIAKSLGVTHRAATVNVEKLVALGILLESDTRKKRLRVFHAPEILALLSAEATSG